MLLSNFHKIKKEKENVLSLFLYRKQRKSYVLDKNVLTKNKTYDYMFI